ncbi:MAG: hypothetical protein ABI423_02415 [Burkholderiales bacterium]
MSAAQSDYKDAKAEQQLALNKARDTRGEAKSTDKAPEPADTVTK